MEDEAIFGDRVERPTGLQGLADPGRISVSGKASNQVRDKAAFGCPEPEKKAPDDIAEPLRVCETPVRFKACRNAALRSTTSKSWKSLAIAVGFVALFAATAAAQRPHSGEIRLGPASAMPWNATDSRALLPFEIRSSDRWSDYPVHATIGNPATWLSNSLAAPEIARNSSFIKGTAAGARQAAIVLGVGYLREGRVGKPGVNPRTAVQLADDLTGAHLRAERFGGTYKGGLVLEDGHSRKTIELIADRRNAGEIPETGYHPAWGEDSISRDEYDYYLRGNSLYFRSTKEEMAQAREIFEEGLERFPESALMRISVGWTLVADAMWGWSTNPERDLARAFELAQEGLADQDAPHIARWYGHWMLSYSYVLYKGDFDRALAEREAAKAIESLEDATLVNPTMLSYGPLLEAAYRLKDVYQQALDQLEKTPPWSETNRMLAATYVQAWHIHKAQAKVREILETEARLSFSRASDEPQVPTPPDWNPAVAGERKGEVPSSPAPGSQMPEQADTRPEATAVAGAEDAAARLSEAPGATVSQSTPPVPQRDQALVDQLAAALAEAQAGQTAAAFSVTELAAALAEARAGQQAAEASATEAAALKQELEAEIEKMRQETRWLAQTAEDSRTEVTRLGEELAATQREKDRLKLALSDARAGQQPEAAHAAEVAALSRQLQATRAELRQEIDRLSVTADSAKADAVRLREELAAAGRESEQLTLALTKALEDQQTAKTSVAELKAALTEARAGQRTTEGSMAELEAELTRVRTGWQGAQASAAEAADVNQELVATQEAMRQEIDRLSVTADSAKVDAVRLGEELAAARRESEQLTATLAEALVGQQASETSVAELEAALTEARTGQQAAEASAAEATALNQELAATQIEMRQEIEGLAATADSAKADSVRLREELAAAHRESEELTAALAEARAGQRAVEVSAAEAAEVNQELVATQEAMRQEIERLSATADSAKADSVRLREELATARREREELTLALTKALEGEQAAEASTAKAAALTQKLAATQEEIETLSTTIVREMGILVDSLNRNVAALGLKKQALEEELAMVSSERDLRSENLTAGDKRDADPAEGKLTEGAGVATEAAKPEATQPRVEIKSASMGTTTSPQEAADDKAAKPSGSAATPPKRAATRPKTPVASKQVATSRDQAEHIVELQSAKAAAGDYSVHLASYKSVERARTGWTTLQGDFPALLGDKTLAMQRIDLGERGIFHRVLAAPFDSRAQAQTFCAELKAKKQYCLVMKR